MNDGDYERAVVVNPWSFTAQNNLAAAYMERAEPVRAVPHARAAVALKPELAMTWINLADALSATGEYREAIDVYRAGLKIRPDHAAGRVNLAIALGHLGQADEAKREFEEAVKTDRAMERAPRPSAFREMLWPERIRRIAPRAPPPPPCCRRRRAAGVRS